jgi:signal transduction histidine kinase
MLKRLEHLRKEWASLVSHDLRQPIGAIVLRSGLLLRAALSDEQRSAIQQIHASAERLNRMVNDLMDASLLEAGRMQMTFDRIGLNQFLHDVVERIPAAAPSTTIRTPPGIDLFIKGDPHRLEQVLANLLTNAVKYGSFGTEIGLELKHVGEHAEIVVSNHGEGIPPESLPLLFDRFKRSATTRTRLVKGLGLGLYIARELVTAHGGRIWAESTPGGVTAFHVTLPLDGPPVPFERLSPRRSDRQQEQLEM